MQVGCPPHSSSLWPPEQGRELHCLCCWKTYNLPSVDRGCTEGWCVFAALVSGRDVRLCAPGVGGGGLYIWQAWAWLWSGSMCDGVFLCVCLAKCLALCVVNVREKWRGCV